MIRFRELSEQAVAAGGLHIAKGGQLWDIYRYEAGAARLGVCLASRLWQPVARTCPKGGCCGSSAGAGPQQQCLTCNLSSD